jgi:hypothetical protein
MTSCKGGQSTYIELPQEVEAGEETKNQEVIPFITHPRCQSARCQAKEVRDSIHSWSVIGAFRVTCQNFGKPQAYFGLEALQRPSAWLDGCTFLNSASQRTVATSEHGVFNNTSHKRFIHNN